MRYRAESSVDDAFAPVDPEREGQPSPEPTLAAGRRGAGAVLSAHEIALIRASVAVVEPHVAELAMAQAGPWQHHDAYLSGPGPMMIAAGRVLGRGGVPLERFHYDPFVRLDVPAP